MRRIHPIENLKSGEFGSLFQNAETCMGFLPYEDIPNSFYQTLNKK